MGFDNYLDPLIEMQELRYKNWITFTPKPFRGDERTFFSRDSGLCCRALQFLGAKAKVVMPEPAWDDERDVLRIGYWISIVKYGFSPTLKLLSEGLIINPFSPTA